MGAFGAVAGVGGAFGLTEWVRTTPAPYLFFTVSEAKLLIPMCEQIIPRDDTPGATDAGVIYYIDRQLMSVFKHHQQTYRAGLDSFRKTCLQLYKTAFEDMPFEKQTEAMRLIEGSRAPKELWSNPSQRALFDLVLEHTRQGFYGSPRHGGNRNYVSYRMMGLAYPNLIGQNRYLSKPL